MEPTEENASCESRYDKVDAAFTVSVNERFEGLRGPGIPTSRRDQKRQLSDLNGRLADYIEEVKSLRKRNEILSSRIAEMASLQCQVEIDKQSLTEAKITLTKTETDLQTVTDELEGLRKNYSLLEEENGELRKRAKKQGKDYCVRTSELENELRQERHRADLHWDNYNKLKSQKISFDSEISIYRELLEGEEGRICGNANRESHETDEKTDQDKSTPPVSCNQQRLNSVDEDEGKKTPASSSDVD